MVGFRDETRRTRRARPGPPAGAGGDPHRPGASARDPEGGGPEAVAGDGVSRPGTGGAVLRCRDRRPVGAATGDSLARACGAVAAEGKTVFVRVRGAAARHLGRRVRRARTGCRIRACGRPVEAPRPNPVEPKWQHGRRAVVEPDRKLTPDELRPRVCDDFKCPHDAPLPKPQP
ncbi:MAG: hypothetical protein C0501_02630 [Isosphaera sp.]|nr:hypothetical protein [Isosphaera sp.]